MALRESLALGHDYVGTEHLLLGLVHENESVAARILLHLDMDAELVRAATLESLSGSTASIDEWRRRKEQSDPPH